MGFGLNTSVGFLAQLNKNGVDASSVMTGLKTALKNGEFFPQSTCIANYDELVLIAEGIKALYGVKWNVTKDRSDLIDYQRCNRMRSAWIPKLGRKNACGLCLAACPYGTGGCP